MTVTKSRSGLRRHDRGQGHTYTLDGVKCDGVTTLIKDGLPKPALVGWAARSVAEYVADAGAPTLDALRGLGRMGMVAALKEVPWNQRNEAAVRGTDVHALAERLAHGEEVEVPERLAGYVESYVKFLDEWQVRPVLTEVVVGNRRWRYAGTSDGVLDLPDGQRLIFDIKTAASGVWPEVCLQLAAYRFAEFYVDGDGAEHPMADLGITAGVAVHVRADGYDVYETPCDEEVFKVFNHIAFIARKMPQMKEWIGPAWEGRR